MNTDSLSYSEKLHALIPGGAHTYSRGDDQFPNNAPPILERGEGAYVFSPDGKKYLDYGMGLRSVNLGYGNEEVAEAVYKETLKGNNLTRASVTELEAAQLFVDMIPSVDMVKFAKHGSAVTTAAYKLARAYTNRKYIAIPVEQPFFSYDDWFIGSTVINRGIPEEYSQLTLKFNYNDIASLERLFEQYPNQIAGVMLEPATTLSPCSKACTCPLSKCFSCENNSENFLHQVKNLAHKNGSLFILDEMITGFRWHLNGAQTLFNIEPDLTTFGKAMANGFAVAALGGKREVMSLGGIMDEGKERIFLTSTTHGAEMSALGAFIKTVEILKRDNVIDHYWSYGTALMNGLNDLAKQKGLGDFFYLEGYPCSPNYVTKDANKTASLAFRTLFAEQMLNSNILMPYIALSAAHGQTELDITLTAAEKAFDTYVQALEHGVDKFLLSKPIKPVFRKYN